MTDFLSNEVPPNRAEFLKYRLPKTYAMIAQLYGFRGSSDAPALIDQLIEIIFQVLQGERRCDPHHPAFQDILRKVTNHTAASIIQAAESLLMSEAFSVEWKDPRPDKRRQDLENAHSIIRQSKGRLLKSLPEEEKVIKQHCADLLAEVEAKKLREFGILEDAERSIPGLQAAIEDAEKQAARHKNYGAQLEANRQANIKKILDERAAQEKAVADAERAAVERRAAQAIEAKEQARERLAKFMEENAGQPEGS